MITVVVVVTVVRIACFECKPRGQLHGQTDIAGNVVARIFSVFVMVVCHDITVGWEFHLGTVYRHVGQTVSVCLVFVVNGHQWRNGVHFFQGILGLFALCDLEVQARIEIKDIFVRIQFQAGIILDVRVTLKDTLLVGMPIRK